MYLFISIIYSKLLQSIQTLLNLPAEEEESERIPINPTNLGKDNSFEKETQQNTSKPINRSDPSSKSNPPPMPPKPVKPSKINPKASKEPNKIEQLKNQVHLPFIIREVVCLKLPCSLMLRIQMGGSPQPFPQNRNRKQQQSQVKKQLFGTNQMLQKIFMTQKRQTHLKGWYGEALSINVS